MANNPFLDVDRLIMGDIYTSSEAMDNLTVLCDDFGSRFGGTAGEKKSVEFMRSKLESYGLENVHLEPVKYVAWRRGNAKLELISPIRREISCITLPHSPPADLEGEVIDMGDGAPDDFERRADEIAGKIVLTTSEVNPKGSKRWIHRGEKYGRSLLAGAIGFIFVNHYPAYGPATGGIGRNDEAPVPGMSVSYEDGAFIQRLIKRMGSVRIQLLSTDHCMPEKSWNLIGDLPGKGSSDESVMIGCHYDGHDISQGATDPASGLVAVMEAARVLALHGGDIPLTIRFALWGVEEIGLLGSKQYMAEHADELDRIRFYFNMDAAGAIVNKGIVLNEWPQLELLLEKWSNEMAFDFGIEQSVNAHSDHFPFLMAGVPTGGMGSVGKESRSGRGYGHTRYDTLDKVNLVGLRDASSLAARLLLRIAHEQEWPASRRTEADVQTVLDSPEYREEAEFRARMQAFYAKRGGD